jgi:hypothetical protein
MKHQPFDRHRRFKDLNWNAVVEVFLLLVGTAVVAIVVAAVISVLSGCQKESSFTSTELTPTDCKLMPKEGFNLTKRDYVPGELAKGQGKGKPPKGKPTNPPADTTNPQPTGAAVLYLDFDGETITGTQWFNLPSYVNPSGLTQSEQDTVFNRTWWEYTQYGYTVTRDKGYYMLAATNRRQMVVFTESWEWFGQAGGVAYVGSFGYEQPCFVFSSLLGYNGKYCADAGIHELGHTLGLHHVPDGQNAYATYGNYMGVAYYVPRGFFEERVVDSYGMTVNQKQIIQSKTL